MMKTLTDWLGLTPAPVTFPARHARTNSVMRDVTFVDDGADDVYIDLNPERRDGTTLHGVTRRPAPAHALSS
jgi:hypothetical protein